MKAKMERLPLLTVGLGLKKTPMADATKAMERSTYSSNTE